jgi:hypothetical protein
MGRRIDESIWNERRELLYRQATSGMPVARFCREHGVDLWKFHADSDRNRIAGPDP